ncbi:protein-tyrosine sulfotransferase-like isoform X2 [Coffea arabica]|uniref:Protein-tyrosine sulfotransferase-like isoform X2 n=1 Tax=Coffea arabica TaxID=13443 RepID=A0ABM4WMS9_COFAR
MRWINYDSKLALLLVLLLSVSTRIKASSEDGEFNQCEHIVKKWASSSLDSEINEDKHILRDLLYFLHVPRTGGRTYYYCFLKRLYANSSECPRSYDRLRLDPRIKASSEDGEFNQCEHIVKKWASSSLDSEINEDKHILRDLLYFLHVPRTGGRTYYYCFLKRLYANSSECPRSYDRLRLDPRKPDCRLLVTHDDYSVMSKLPREKTSVVTILRDPIDRVFSTYEFSVEVAARFLVHPNLTSALRMTGRLRAKTRGGVSTLDIWPWKYLVPWMREDLFSRREARRRKGWPSIYGDDPYDMEDVVMPLHKYINDPIAQEIVHNGATYQIAGLTNNSYLAESHEVRHCIQKYQPLGEYVLDVAKKRLDNMLYVGLTENHRESATMFANVVGAQAISKFAGSNSRKGLVANSIPGQSSLIPDIDPDSNYHLSNSTYPKPGKFSSTDTVEATNEDMTTRKLMEGYETCISSLRSTQSQRRANSLKNIRPANFTKEARRRISKVLFQEITSLNYLDVELYKYAQGIFANQQQYAMPTKVGEKMTRSRQW